MSDPLLLDTCALIWLMSKSIMAPRARRAIFAAAQRNNICISSVSAWEAAMLESRGRAPFSVTARNWYGDVLSNPGFQETPVTADIFMSSCQLPGDPPRDPIDRLLIATSREYGFTVVTRDRAILAYGESGHARVLAC